jgi:hypothetical protein
MIFQKISLAKANAEISNAYPHFIIHTKDLASHVKAYGTLLENERIIIKIERSSHLARKIWKRETSK